jgi:tripartite-type tricarboxylate transporter receptor subunit TctC
MNPISPAVQQVLSLALFLVATGPAGAQAWPTKPVRLVLSQASATSPDIVARLLGDRLSKVWGHAIVVENKPGGQNVIGAQRAAASSPDGYSFYYATTAALVINAYTFKSLPYDPRKDFVPVGMIGQSPFVIAVNSDLPAKSLKDLIAYARANPGKLSAATEGAKTFSGMMADMFAKTAGLNLVAVPYSGVTPAIQDTLTGRTQLTVMSSAALTPYHKRLRAVAVTSAKRVPGLEDVPTLGEMFPGFQYVGWHAIVAPRGTPAPAIQRFSQDLNSVLSDPEIAKRLFELGLIVEGAGTPAQLGAFFNAEHARWAKLARDVGVVPD